MHLADEFNELDWVVAIVQLLNPLYTRDKYF